MMTWHAIQTISIGLMRNILLFRIASQIRTYSEEGENIIIGGVNDPCSKVFPPFVSLSVSKCQAKSQYTWFYLRILKDLLVNLFF